MKRIVRGVTAPLSRTQTFTPVPLLAGSLPVDQAASDAFRRQTRELQRALFGIQRSLDEAQSRLTLQRRAAEQWPAVPRSVLADLDQVRLELRSIERELSGDRSRSPHEEAPESIASRVNSVVFGHWRTTANPTGTQRRSLEVARDRLRPLVERLRRVIDVEMSQIDAASDAAGAPWTPGRRLDVP